MNNKYGAERPNIPAEIRRSVEIESGHRCAIKGCFEHTYLEIHHIDTNRDNNSLENLILLCDKHHKMAHANIIDRKALREYKRLNQQPTINDPTSLAGETKTDLHVVDIYELENNNDIDYEVTTIEIKLRNSGKEVVFLKETIFETNKHWELSTDRHHSLVNVSAEYDVNISELPGHISKIKVHHEIKPQETDRIHFRLSTNYDSDPEGLSLFMMCIKFLYNEDSRQVSSCPAILNIRPRSKSIGSYFPQYSPGTISKNKAIAREVIDLSLAGISVEKYVIDALNSWLNAPSEEEYFSGIKDA